MKIEMDLWLFGVVFFLAVGGASAGIVMINFDHDTSGSKVNGFQSVDSDLVSFSDSLGSDLTIDADEGWGQSNGYALAVLYDDASYLIMDFSVDVIDFSLSFGNDDPGWAVAGDEAVLTLFKNNVEVAQSRVELNLNDIMDQRIEITNVEFDRAFFLYEATQIKDGLIELVDDIEFTVVPQPATILLLGLGSLMLRRFRHS